MLFRVEPQSLVVALAVGDFTAHKGCGIVAHTLSLARTADSRSDKFFFDENFGRLKSVSVIRTYGRKNDKEFIFMACVYTEHFFVCNHSRSDIKSRTGFGRYPVFFELEEFEQSRLYHFCVKRRHAHTLCRIVHTYKVVVDSEYGNFAFFGLVSLCAFENTLRIVKHVGSGIHFERSVRYDFRLFPRAVFVVHYEHMVGKIFTETEF